MNVVDATMKLVAVNSSDIRKQPKEMIQDMMLLLILSPNGVIRIGSFDT